MFLKECVHFPSWRRGAGSVLYLSSQHVPHTVIYIALEHTVPYLATKKLFTKLSAVFLPAGKEAPGPRHRPWKSLRFH